MTELHMGLEKGDSGPAYGMVTFARLVQNGRGVWYQVTHDPPQKFYLHYESDYWMHPSENAEATLTRKMVPALIDVR